MKEDIRHLIEITIMNLIESGILSKLDQITVEVEFSRDEAHGDFASNIALSLAKSCQMAPTKLANLIQEYLPAASFLDRCEVAGPGFLNFFLSREALSEIVTKIIKEGDRFGWNQEGKGEPVLVEFVSANPTGPLHVGHGRGAAIGDSICRLMRANGWDVKSEFYYNDAGQQIRNLALSVQARCFGIEPGEPGWPEDGYCGVYIRDIAESYIKGDTIEAKDKFVTGAKDPNLTDQVQEFAVTYLRREQDEDLKHFDVFFDSYFLESSLYIDGGVERTVNRLIDSGHTYEKDGALWLMTTNFGDDKDRVMRKQDNNYTYFIPDVAYHLNKWDRGFSVAINEQGADHHGTISRVRAGLQALNNDIPENWPSYLLHQMVTVFRDGKEVKISKRAGDYVTLSDLISEVGPDATRYFLVARAPHSQLVFDIDLALSKTSDNPVFYIQYAHARIASVIRKMTKLESGWYENIDFSNLNILIEKEENLILQKLIRFPEVVKRAGEKFEPHILANYLRELAGEFHSYYNSHKVLVESKKLRKARAALCMAVGQVIANGLYILGVSAPEEM